MSVSKNFQRNRVFGWNLMFETAETGGGNYAVYYFDPNGVDMYKIQLDPATVTLAKNLIAQIQSWMNQTDAWSGTVLEHRQKKQVTHPSTVTEDWVQV